MSQLLWLIGYFPMEQDETMEDPSFWSKQKLQKGTLTVTLSAFLHEGIGLYHPLDDITNPKFKLL